MENRNGDNNNDRERQRERIRQGLNNNQMQVMRLAQQIQQNLQRNGQVLPAVGVRMVNRVSLENVANRSLSSTSSIGSPVAIKRRATCMLPETVDTSATSEIEQDVFSFLWTLKQFSVFRGNEEVKSPVFKGGPKSNHSWQLKIAPQKKVENVDYLSVHLILAALGEVEKSERDKKIKVRFQISILDVDGKPGKQAGNQNMAVCEFKKLGIWGYDKFMSTQDLMNPAKKLVEDDVLRIHCKVWIEGDIKHNEISVPTFRKRIENPEQTKMRRLNSLSTDMKDMLECSRSDNNFADVAISTKTKTFMAHKCVIAARSKVFAAMFQSNMRESQKNEVVLEEFGEDVVNAMLQYIYTGETDLLADEAVELLRISEMYELMGLKDDCERALAESFTIENVSQILVHAHFHSPDNLKPHVINFINRHKDDVIKTESFKDVASKHPEVFPDLYVSMQP